MQKNEIGWISHSDHNPIVFTDKGSEIIGFLNPAMRGKTLAPGTPLIIEGEDTKTKNAFKIFSRLTRVETCNKFSYVEQQGNMVNNFVMPVYLKPFHEITWGNDPYEGPFNNLHSLSRSKIRFPVRDEFYDVLGIPKKGIPFGLLDEIGVGDELLPYNYDLEKIYRSMFVGGHQGSGKTNFLRYLVRVLMGQKTKDKPAIIILDIEPEFTKLGTSKPDKKAKKVLKKWGIPKLTNVNITNINSSSDSGKILDLSLLGPEEFVLLMSSLSERTEPLMKNILEEAWQELSEGGYKFGVHELIEIAKAKIDMRSVANVHPSQKRAMINALSTVETRIFDQLGRDKVSITGMLKPGKVSVINISELHSDSERRTVVLYMMMALAKYKIKVRGGPGVILMVDEARDFFPNASQGKLKKDYIKRIEDYIQEIIHKGRKRKYGLVFATQHPTDVSKTIIDLCNTRVLFRSPLATQERWINSHFRKGYSEKVKELRDGEAFIICRDIHVEPVKIYAPFLGKVAKVGK